MPPLQSSRIVDQLRERIRYLHYSLRTEEAYVYWVKGFIRFHQLRHPAEMGKAAIEAYLMWLVADRNVSSSTHRQALSALLFLYGKRSTGSYQEKHRVRCQQRFKTDTVLASTTI